MTATQPWLASERDQLAVDRVLDAAGELFAERGVTAVGMAEIAAATGCSRATVYRYFDNRHDLRLAFVQREARRLGAKVATKVERTRDPAARLEKAVLAAIDGVRSTPVLAAWFDEENAGSAVSLAGASGVIESLAAGFLDEVDSSDEARWVVRVVISLLVMPGRDAAEERRIVRRFVVGPLTHPGSVA